MKKLFLITSLVFICNFSFAKQIDTLAASKVASAFLEKSIENYRVEEMYLLKATSNYYIFNYGITGFVLIAADDVAYPVLGYSDKSSFKLESMPPALEALLEEFQNEISWAKAHSYPSAEIQNLWKQYLDNQLVTGTFSYVPPLMSTSWGQGAWYNANCPNQTPAGCAAVAQAQIIKYHNYPSSGTGSHSYNTSYGVELAR